MDYRTAMRRYAGYGPMPYYCEMGGLPGSERHSGSLYVAWQWFRHCCRVYSGPFRLCRADGTVLANRY